MGARSWIPRTPVAAAIAKKYCPPQWATFFEVRNDAGFAGDRSADVLSVGLWRSMNLAIHGFEVKQDRRDFLNEMKTPEKSDAVARYCDHWWLAIDDEKIAKPEEVPGAWGLVLAKGGELVTIKKAPKLEPAPLERGFIAMVLRRASEHVVPLARLDELVAERVGPAVEAELKMAANGGERAIKELKELKAKVEAFEKASGIDIAAGWRFGEPEKLGTLLSSLMRGYALPDLEHLQRVMTGGTKQVAELSKLLREVKAAFEAMKGAA